MIKQGINNSCKKEQPFELLAKAVILEAVNEYKELMRANLKNKSDSYKIMWRNDVRDLELFFNSEWCSELSGGNGKYILRKLKELRRID